MTTSKIKIKLGAIEVEYEGSESFLKEELPQLLAAVSDLYQKSLPEFSPQDSGISNTAASGTNPKEGVNAKIQGTTGSVAARLQCKSGPDLVMAAAAKLSFVDKVSIFSRQRLIEEMKTASAYYKASYVSNLSKTLNTLVKDSRLNEPTQDNYALTARSIQELEPRIA